MRKNLDISDVFPAQKKRKFSNNFCQHPQYIVQNRNLIRAILSCTLPLSIVNNSDFRKFCSSLDSRFKLSSSDFIRTSILNSYDQTNKLIQNEIIETAEFVALTLDFWTSYSYFGITCHWLMHDFKLIEIVLDVSKFSEEHAAAEIFEKLQFQLSKFKIAHENIVSITIENEDSNNVKAALSQLQIEIIPCLANILRISIDSGLSYANNIINKSKKLIELLNNDTNRQKLRDLQPHPNLVDIENDWNSVYQAIHNLIILQPSILYLSGEDKKLKENMLSEDEFDICKELDVVLTLFYELTEMLKHSKYPALSFMTPAIENIKQRLSIYQPKNNVVQQVKVTILDNLKKNFDAPLILGLYSSFFDPRFKKFFYIESELRCQIINNLHEQFTKLLEPTTSNPETINKDSKMLSFFHIFIQENRQTEFDKYLELSQLDRYCHAKIRCKYLDSALDTKSLKKKKSSIIMFFDNFTPIEETNLLSEIKSSNGVNGITIFIPCGYSSVLICNNENVNSKNMIKELLWLNLKIPAFILNTESDTPLNEKTATKPAKCFLIFRNGIHLEIQKQYPWLSNHEVSKLAGILWNILDSKSKEKYKQLAEIEQLENNAQEPYSEESNENNAQKPYYDESSEKNNINTPYSEESSEIQKTYAEKNDILGLNTSNQLGCESTENLENSSLIYDQSGNPDYSSMGMSTLDIQSLMSFINDKKFM
ncbi:15274_t:CDS:2 [Dentiscutata erythropus]|uniref:15274_t:CDS:1 n=1 Tax=Dentiscutata erythropus TaxID=1348616 RepID=A0A9N9AEE3_9GLOM|nr:15274_t:CDS:2 [Dentiscutata erythropus]